MEPRGIKHRGISTSTRQRRTCGLQPAPSQPRTAPNRSRRAGPAAPGAAARPAAQNLLCNQVATLGRQARPLTHLSLERFARLSLDFGNLLRLWRFDCRRHESELSERPSSLRRRPRRTEPAALSRPGRATCARPFSVTFCERSEKRTRTLKSETDWHRLSTSSRAGHVLIGDTRPGGLRGLTTRSHRKARAVVAAGPPPRRSGRRSRPRRSRLRITRSGSP